MVAAFAVASRHARRCSYAKRDIQQHACCNPYGATDADAFGDANVHGNVYPNGKPNQYDNVLTDTVIDAHPNHHADTHGHSIGNTDDDAHAQSHSDAQPHGDPDATDGIISCHRDDSAVGYTDAIARADRHADEHADVRGGHCHAGPVVDSLTDGDGFIDADCKSVDPRFVDTDPARDTHGDSHAAANRRAICNFYAPPNAHVVTDRNAGFFCHSDGCRNHYRHSSHAANDYCNLADCR